VRARLPLLPQVEAALGVCGLRKDARAQDLSLANFVAVHAELKKSMVAELLGGGGDEEVEEDDG
jgi:hypothetical protein